MNVDMSVKRHVCEKDYVWNSATCNCKNGIYLASILLALLLITIALLITVSTYCYLIKYRAKQKHLLPFNFTNNKLKEIIY